jgi:choline dehydrogenase-like flavoprotein
MHFSAHCREVPSTSTRTTSTATPLSNSTLSQTPWTDRFLLKWFAGHASTGPEFQTDDEIIDALIQQNGLTASFAHMSGTCSMMPESLGGCVSSDLAVYGIRQLSVVDASIIPLIPATHLQSTMYAVAEKAADIIKARNRVSGFFRFIF